jgi:hypothetical protein
MGILAYRPATWKCVSIEIRMRYVVVVCSYTANMAMNSCHLWRSTEKQYADYCCPMKMVMNRQFRWRHNQILKGDCDDDVPQ